jgi:hypothetical protein
MYININITQKNTQNRAHATHNHTSRARTQTHTQTHDTRRACMETNTMQTD